MAAMILASLALVTTLLAGCGASTSDIVPVGSDSYL
jgi:hypothetical protein